MIFVILIILLVFSILMYKIIVFKNTCSIVLFKNKYYVYLGKHELYSTETYNDAKAWLDKNKNYFSNRKISVYKEKVNSMKTVISGTELKNKHCIYCGTDFQYRPTDIKTTFFINTPYVECPIYKQNLYNLNNT